MYNPSSRTTLLKILYVSSALGFLYLYPGVEELEITNMLFHMLAEHFIFASSGFIILSLYEDFMRSPLSSQFKELRRIYTRLLMLNRRVNRHGVAGFVLAGFILAY